MTEGQSVSSLPVTSITANTSAQSRVKANKEAIDAYAADMVAGAIFPPVVVFWDGTTYWLADGFQRLAATRKANIATIAVTMFAGGLREAIFHGASANADHGCRRSNADKRRAVLMLLDDPEWSKLSNREISRHCGVSHQFTSNIKAEKSPPASAGGVATVANPSSEGSDAKGASTTQRKASAVRADLPKGIASAIGVGLVKASDQALVKYGKLSPDVQQQVTLAVGTHIATGDVSEVVLGTVIDETVAADERASNAIAAEEDDDEADESGKFDTSRVGNTAMVPVLSPEDLAKYQTKVKEAIKRLGRLSNLTNELAEFWPHGAAWRSMHHESISRLIWLLEPETAPKKYA